MGGKSTKNMRWEVGCDIDIDRDFDIDRDLDR